MAFQPLSFRLLEAAHIGDISLTKKLFKFKVKTDILDSNGDSPLSLAVKSNHVSIVKMLLEYGANIEHQNRQLNRPIHQATMNGNEEMLILLLSHGAQFDRVNHEGFLPLQLAHSNSKIHRILQNAGFGLISDPYEEINEVPIIPDYTIPVPKVKSDKKGKKDKKKKGSKKKGKKK